MKDIVLEEHEGMIGGHAIGNLSGHQSSPAVQMRGQPSGSDLAAAAAAMEAGPGGTGTFVGGTGTFVGGSSGSGAGGTPPVLSGQPAFRFPNDEGMATLPASSHGAMAAAARPSGMHIAGIRGFCTFLNGTYLRQRGMMHGERLTFRSKEKAPSSAGPAGGNYVFLFYHGRNTAWVLGLKITESSGAAAYRKGIEAVPSDAGPDKLWSVSNKIGKFVDCVGVTCDAIMGGETVEPELSLLPPRSPSDPSSLVQPTGTSRTDAQQMLLLEADRSSGDDGAGAFVVRESTSVPNSFVLSVLLSRRRIEHILVKAEDDGYSLNSTSFPSLKSMVEFYQRNRLPVGEDGTELIRLSRCVHGQSIYMSMNELV
jgi:hypothetical protein